MWPLKDLLQAYTASIEVFLELHMWSERWGSVVGSDAKQLGLLHVCVCGAWVAASCQYYQQLQAAIGQQISRLYYMGNPWPVVMPEIQAMVARTVCMYRLDS